jgi:hypothetical protein
MHILMLVLGVSLGARYVALKSLNLFALRQLSA